MYLTNLILTFLEGKQQRVSVRFDGTWSGLMRLTAVYQTSIFVLIFLIPGLGHPTRQENGRGDYAFHRQTIGFTRIPSFPFPKP